MRTIIPFQNKNHNICTFRAKILDSVFNKIHIKNILMQGYIDLIYTKNASQTLEQSIIHNVSYELNVVNNETTRNFINSTILKKALKQTIGTQNKYLNNRCYSLIQNTNIFQKLNNQNKNIYNSLNSINPIFVGTLGQKQYLNKYKQNIYLNSLKKAYQSSVLNDLQSSYGSIASLDVLNNYSQLITSYNTHNGNINDNLDIKLNNLIYIFSISKKLKNTKLYTYYNNQLADKYNSKNNNSSDSKIRENNINIYDSYVNLNNEYNIMNDRLNVFLAYKHTNSLSDSNSNLYSSKLNILDTKNIKNYFSLMDLIEQTINKVDSEIDQRNEQEKNNNVIKSSFLNNKVINNIINKNNSNIKDDINSITIKSIENKALYSEIVEKTKFIEFLYDVKSYAQFNGYNKISDTIINTKSFRNINEKNSYVDSFIQLLLNKYNKENYVDKIINNHSINILDAKNADVYKAFSSMVTNNIATLENINKFNKKDNNAYSENDKINKVLDMFYKIQNYIQSSSIYNVDKIIEHTKSELLYFISSNNGLNIRDYENLIDTKNNKQLNEYLKTLYTDNTIIQSLNKATNRNIENKTANNSVININNNNYANKQNSSDINYQNNTIDTGILTQNQINNNIAQIILDFLTNLENVDSKTGNKTRFTSYKDLLNRYDVFSKKTTITNHQRLNNLVNESIDSFIEFTYNNNLSDKDMKSADKVLDRLYQYKKQLAKVSIITDNDIAENAGILKQIEVFNNQLTSYTNTNTLEKVNSIIKAIDKIENIEVTKNTISNINKIDKTDKIDKTNNIKNIYSIKNIGNRLNQINENNNNYKRYEIDSIYNENNITKNISNVFNTRKIDNKLKQLNNTYNTVNKTKNTDNSLKQLGDRLDNDFYTSLIRYDKHNHIHKNNFVQGLSSNNYHKNEIDKAKHINQMLLSNNIAYYRFNNRLINNSYIEHDLNHFNTNSNMNSNSISYRNINRNNNINSYDNNSQYTNGILKNINSLSDNNLLNNASYKNINVIKQINNILLSPVNTNSLYNKINYKSISINHMNTSMSDIAQPIYQTDSNLNYGYIDLSNTNNEYINKSQNLLTQNSDNTYANSSNLDIVYKNDKAQNKADIEKIKQQYINVEKDLYKRISQIEETVNKKEVNIKKISETVYSSIKKDLKNDRQRKGL